MTTKVELPPQIAAVRTHILAAKEALTGLPSTREHALTKSKLDEAELWLMSALVS